jgi:Raf kinase inhibitor-like YbhB/YbcL family protein
MRFAAAAALSVILLTGCGGDDKVPGEPPSASLRMTLAAPGISNGGSIPKAYTCEGRNFSPPLAWDGTPGNARELAIVVEDPDAPGDTFVHWVVAGIDPRTQMLDAGARLEDARQGRNSAGEARYTGPCPPEGDKPHRYVFSVYALRERTDAPNGAPAETMIGQIRENAMATGRLTGRFGR